MTCVLLISWYVSKWVQRLSCVLVSNFALCACLYFALTVKISLVWHRLIITLSLQNGSSQLASITTNEQWHQNPACLCHSKLGDDPRYKHAQWARSWVRQLTLAASDCKQRSDLLCLAYFFNLNILPSSGHIIFALFFLVYHVRCIVPLKMAR